MLKLQRHLKLAGLVATALLVSACNPYQIKSAQNDFSTSTYTYRMASLHGENAKLRELWLEDSKGSIEAMSSKNLRYACDALMEIGDFREARTCLAALREQEPYDWMSEEFDETTHRYFSDALLARYHFLIGDYRQAIALADEVIENLHLKQDTWYKRRDPNFWYGQMTAGYAAGMSQIALGKSAISERYYRALDNHYNEGHWQDQDRKLYVTRRAEMLFVERRYSEALALLTGEESENTTSEKVASVLQHIQALGIAALVNKASTGDANLTGANRFAGNRHLHLYMVAKARLELGQREDAKAIYDSLLEKLKDASYNTFYWKAAHDRALIAQQEGDNELADRLFSMAIDALEEQRSTLTTDGNKISFVGDKQRLYQDYVAFLVDEQRYAAAFEYSDKAKARALVDMLANREFKSEGQSEAQQLYRELRDLQADSSVVAGIGTEQQKADKTRALKRVYKKIETSNAQLSSLVSAETPSVAEIQQRLGDDEALIQYYKLKNRYHAFLLTHEGVRSYPLPQASVDEVDQAVGDFRQALMAVDNESYQLEAQALYDRLLRPMQSQLQQRKLILVADGALHYLPFAALHDGRQFVLQRHQLRALSAASVLTLLEQRDVRGQRLIALGNPDLGNPDLDLPGAEQEVKALRQLLSQAEVVTRQQATETRIKQLGEGYSVLHIASHGQFDASQPLASRLLLSADGSNDGVLTVGELYDLSLPAKLVVLSACETGLGDVKNGGDVIGLTRGFLYAGASSVVSTLWMVADETTKQLMLDFYRQLQQQSQQDIGEALTTAQRRIFRQVNPHPYYWAAFQLTGSI